MIFNWHKGNCTKVSLTLSINSNHLGQGWCWCLNGRAEHRRVKTAWKVPGFWGSLGPCLTWDIHRENLWADPVWCYLHRGIQPRCFCWGIFHEIYDIYIYALLICTCHMYIYTYTYTWYIYIYIHIHDIYICICICIWYDEIWFDLILCYIYLHVWYDMI